MMLIWQKLLSAFVVVREAVEVAAVEAALAASRKGVTKTQRTAAYVKRIEFEVFGALRLYRFVATCGRALRGFAAKARSLRLFILFSSLFCEKP